MNGAARRADTQRLFIAVDPPAGTGRLVDRAVERLTRSGVRAAWVDPAAVHVTLAFLGAVATERLPDIRRAMDRACDGVVPFAVSLGRLGAFPDVRTPRTIWLGIGRGAEQLVSLQRALAAELGPLGFAPERRPFHPHVTIGRVRDRRGCAVSLPDNAASAESALPAGWVEEVVLMASVPAARGRRYERLYAVRLSPDPGG